MNTEKRAVGFLRWGWGCPAQFPAAPCHEELEELEELESSLLPLGWDLECPLGQYGQVEGG